MESIKQGNWTINTILADDKLMLIYGWIQATLTSDFHIEGNYDNNHYFNVDLTTLDANIKVLTHGKRKCELETLWLSWIGIIHRRYRVLS